ncbi:hypothetical protein D9M68_706840 [compost metagenome]
MRVFAIAHHFAQFAGKAAIGNFGIVDRFGEPARNGAVIGGGAGIGFCGQLLAQLVGNAAIADGFEDRRIIGGVDDDGHKGVVLGCRAHHGGAANVDILDDLVIGRAGGDGLFEGVEIDGDEIDGADLVFSHRCLMLGIVAHCKKAAMDLWMQRLDPAVHHFGKAREIGNLAHRQAGIANELVSAAGRNQLHARGAEPLGEVCHARLVEYRKQRPPDLDRLAHKGISHSVMMMISRSLARSGARANQGIRIAALRGGKVVAPEHPTHRRCPRT